MRRLVLVRHGESTWNAQRRVQGQGGAGLTDRGREQAGHTAAWIAATYPRARLFSSDLQRCRETAAPLAHALGREPSYDEQLRERDFGPWTGALVSDIVAENPERARRWRAGEDVVAEVGGESTEALRTRVVAWLGTVLDGLPEDGVAVCVTHGGPVWHGTTALLSLPHGVLGPVANTSVTEIAQDGRGQRTLLSWNQVTHLPARLHTTLRTADTSRPDAQAPAVGR